MNSNGMEAVQIISKPKQIERRMSGRNFDWKEGTENLPLMEFVALFTKSSLQRQVFTAFLDQIYDFHSIACSYINSLIRFARKILFLLTFKRENMN